VNNLPQRLLLVVFGATAGLLSVGQMVPSDTSQVAAGETLPQVLLWLVVWTIFVLSLVLSGSLQTLNLSGRRIASSSVSSVSGSSATSENGTTSNALGYWFVAAIVFTIIWVFLAAWNVFGVGNFRFAINAWWQWIAWFAAFFLIFRLVQIGGTTEPFIKWMIALCFLVSLHGCYQVFISLPADRERFRNDPQAVLAEAGIEAAPGSSTYMLFEGRLRDTSPTGPFALTNSLAGFLLPWLVVLFAHGFHRIVDRPPYPREHDFNLLPSRMSVAATVVGALMLWVLVMTQSRTAWIALMVGCFVYVVNHPRVINQLKRLANPYSAVFVFMIIGLVLAIYAWDRKLVLEAPQSIAYRLEYWQTTWRMAREQFWLGVGPGNFQAYFATYKSLESSETVADPHNFLFEALGTAGMPALIGLCAAIFFGLSLGWIRRTEDGTSPEGFNPTKGSFEAASIAVYSGGVVGLIFVWVSVGALGPAPVTTPYWLGIPIVIAYFVWSFYRAGIGSIDTSRLPKKDRGKSTLDPLQPPQTIARDAKVQGIGAAIVALLVHLLASGGWMTPGVGNSLAVLVAIWFSGMIFIKVQSPVADAISAKYQGIPVRSANFRSWFAAIGAVTPMLLLLVFYFSTWLPTQKLKSLQNGLQDLTIPITRARLDDLIASDPWDPFPSRFVADLAYREALEVIARRQITNDLISKESTQYQTIRTARDLAQSYRAKDLANWQVWLQSGQWELALAAYESESLSTSLTNFQEASRLAPSELGILTQVALVAWIADDKKLAIEAWEQAAALQERITHVDRKLFGASLYWPPSVGPKSTRLAPAVWQKARDAANIDSSSRPGWVRAEPVFEFLRTQLGMPSPLK
jgi:O-antigen ligase